MYIETNYNYLPLPYRLAIERLGQASDRSLSMLRAWCNDYATVYALPHDETHWAYTLGAERICQSRYGLR